MDISTIFFAQAAQPQGGGIPPLLIMGLMFAAMYFLIIAPQRKKQKQHQKMITELKSGAEVVTSGGIYGTITNVKEDRFILKIAENTKIEISKASVATVINAAE
ncbi:preprotein translocase subunit YajC [Pelagicoccus mobilis]|uniref:Sec translocon accessory complex subunit YajC n=1 Tax=Pelagicoccus mobilis TaxID=415221 RepID=A0A934VPH9_9BACT|nr:preprotein translocase subunit YajC [Pelagicoccus mobilis]MBK1875840.1 preprotein translocase subunit YajC [Pelagicoccus mobilis]